MPKDSKCGKKLCKKESKSDSSEVCYKVKCEPKCEKDCSIKECPCISPEKLVCEKKDAVVQIHSSFILIGGSEEGQITGATPLSANGRADVFLEGNGFFIHGHYIVTSAQNVLMPPSLTSVANRYPYFDAADLSLGQMKDQMIRPSRILVSVFNVNGKGHSFVYEADLVGVDGAGDIAVLRINYKKQWNLCNPCIESCHPFFCFGESRASLEGEKVYLIGDYVSNAVDRSLFNAVGAVTEGLLSDRRYVDYSGFALPEAVLVSAGAYAFSSGLPIINCRGEVIGMQTSDLATVLPRIQNDDVIFFNRAEGSGLVAGPSQYFMQRIVNALIKGTCRRKFNNQLETICDPAGSFYRYKKAYAGVAYDVFTGIDYDTTTDYTAGGLQGDFAGRPRVRLSPTGEFLNYPTCKELIGIRVLGLAGANPNDAAPAAPAAGIANGFWFVPGGSVGLGSIFPDNLPISPFLGKIQPGDVITHINGVALGDLECQVAPSLITWRLSDKDQIDISYRRGGNAPNDFDNGATDNYDNLYSHTFCLVDYPRLMDYPWYAVNRFPLLAAAPFNFVFPGAQLTNPQVPGTLGGAPFHPAF